MLTLCDNRQKALQNTGAQPHQTRCRQEGHNNDATAPIAPSRLRQVVARGRLQLHQ